MRKNLLNKAVIAAISYTALSLFSGCAVPDKELAVGYHSRWKATERLQATLESGTESEIKLARSRYDWTVGWVQGYKAAKGLK